MLIIALDFDLTATVLSHCRYSIASLANNCAHLVTLNQQPNRNDDIIIFSCDKCFNRVWFDPSTFLRYESYFIVQAVRKYVTERVLESTQAIGLT